jgi:hypothetical protein
LLGIRIVGATDVGDPTEDLAIRVDRNENARDGVATRHVTELAVI